jgi:hypothetical protein
VPDLSSNPYAATKAGTARSSSSSTPGRRLLSGRRHLADRRMNIELLQSTIRDAGAGECLLDFPDKITDPVRRHGGSSTATPPGRTAPMDRAIKRGRCRIESCVWTVGLVAGSDSRGQPDPSQGRCAHWPRTARGAATEDPRRPPGTIVAARRRRCRSPNLAAGPGP